jgi:uncharacterized protein (TIGR02284 family)
MVQPRHVDEKEIARTLNSLIELNTDAAKGYATASADARSPVLKGVLSERAKESGARVVALQNALQRMGKFAENQGTARGTLHRNWLDVRLALEGRSDVIVLEECERGEAAVLRAYENISTEVLKKLPPDVAVIVDEQHFEFRDAYEDTIRRLRDLRYEMRTNSA